MVIKQNDAWNSIADIFQHCLSNVNSWMQSNVLKLNQDKTELIIFAPKRKSWDFSECKHTFGGAEITSASCVKNLGVFIDRFFTRDVQIIDLVKICYFQIISFHLLHEI
jgi:hypothetical protein